MRDFKKYDVWEKSHELVLYIYKNILPELPQEEKYGLSKQLSRAAYSIPLNIAEGCGRSSDKDFSHFLDMALGSAHEVEYCSILAADLCILDTDKNERLNSLINEVKAMLISLIKSIRKRFYNKTSKP